MQHIRNLMPKYCDSPVLLKGKTVIVTGSNTGIGKEAARDFVKRGARVILACRNLDKANAAAADIKTAGTGEVVVRRLDLSSQRSIRDFAKEISVTEQRVDILVNNAGILGPKGKTEDGIDLTFGTNHLGPFLLTNLLLDKIKQSKPARIVTVSSGVHADATLDFNDITLDKPGSYGAWKAYTQSKLCNILFSDELARRLQGSGVNVYSLHPGFVNTDLFRNFPAFLKPVALLIFPLISKSAVQGAQTTIHCAVSDDVKNDTGLYYDNCKVSTPSKLARDQNAAKKLWEISERLSGLKQQ